MKFNSENILHVSHNSLAEELPFVFLTRDIYLKLLSKHIGVMVISQQINFIIRNSISE